MVGQPVQPPAALGLPQRFLLTAEHYTHPRWQGVERQAIFGRSWLYAGDARLAPGTARALTVAGIEVLLSCDGSGTLRAFHNLCPHRAAQLLEPGTQAEARLVCPYHAWTYDLAGNLVGAPSSAQFGEAFCPEHWPLRPVALATWADFAFICLDPDPQPLIEVLGSIPELLGNHRTPRSQLLAHHQRTVRCNWKNYHDNTLCDYHVAVAHRTTLHRLQGPLRHYRHQLEPYVNLLYTPTTADWRAANPVLPGLQGNSRDGFFTYGIYPNLHLLGMPSGLLAWLRIDPLDCHSAQLTLELYGDTPITPSTPSNPRTAPSLPWNSTATPPLTRRGSSCARNSSPLWKKTSPWPRACSRATPAVPTPPAPSTA